MTTALAPAAPEKYAGLRGNQSAGKHLLTAGEDQWPKDSPRIREAVEALRTQIEVEVLARLGEVDVYHAALIQSATRHERRAQLLQRWLRLEGKSLPLEQRIALLKDLSAATRLRDEALQKLGLDKKAGGNFWDLLPTPATAEQPTAD